jgi:PAS domain S-box-containing protein
MGPADMDRRIHGNEIRQLEPSQALFQGMLESAPDGMVITDAGGRILLVNTQTEQLSGYMRHELIGQLVEVLVPERYGEIHIQHRSEYMATPRTRSMGVGLDLYLRRKDGSELPVEISLSPIQTPEQILVFASIRDVTTRKQSEAKIKRLNDELQHHVEQLLEANREMESFSYSVSHDLRAPLRSMDGFSKVLMERYADQMDERGRNYLSRVRAAAQKMGRLIDDMLSLSRIGRTQMRWDQVDLSEMATAIVEELRQREPERQVVVTITPNMKVSGDPALLQIVFTNLIGNAWKFTGKREEAHIDVGLKEERGERIYFVRDNGAGFDMAFVDKLFTSFQRLHTEEDYSGTGIGLAIVKRIILRHEGRIWAEGAVDQGATFYFTLESQFDERTDHFVGGR